VLSTVYHWNGYSESLSDFANTLSTSAGSKTHTSRYWPTKNKEHS